MLYLYVRVVYYVYMYRVTVEQVVMTPVGGRRVTGTSRWRGGAAA